MPVSFKPGDSRERKKEAQEPKIPKTVDEQVKEIADKYYAEQKRRKHVDNWGQPLHKLDEGKIRQELQKAKWEARTKFDDGKGKRIPERLSDAMGRSPSSKNSSDAKDPSERREPKENKERSSPREKRATASQGKPQEGQERAAHDVGSDTKRKAQPDTKLEKTASDIAERFRDEQRTKRFQDDGKKSSLRERFASLAGMTADTAMEKHRKNQGEISPEGKKESKRDYRKEAGMETDVKEVHKDAKTLSTQESTGRLGPKNNLRYGEVNGEQVKTPERLKELLDGEYEGIKSRKDFPKLHEEALAHMEMVKRYEGMERIPYGETSRIAKELGRNPETVRQWTKGENAGLYRFMEYATPKSEAAEKVRHLLEANNGVRSPEDVRARYDNYYFGEAERTAKFFPREEEKMKKYFELLERYSKGGIHLDIAKEVGLSDSGARAYLEGAKPWQVSIASQIPAEAPREGYKWLPKTGGINAVRDDWIEVPEKVTDWKQVKELLEKTNTLNNEDMKRWAKEFEPWSKEESFMYLLGAYISDSKVPSSSTTSIAFGMNLSKAYAWSEDFGEACCYSLGKIGIKAHRVSDKDAFTSKIETPYGLREIKGKSQYEWISETSPLIRWMRKSCLGYDDTAKTYQKVDAKWVLAAPDNLRRGFLQGFSDGDGGVSARGYYFSISTHSDHQFVEELLNSFGVDTYRSRTYVRTAGFDALKQMEKSQPFRHATQRQESLEKAVQMIEARKASWKSSPPSVDEIGFMRTLRQGGASYGEIGEKLFDEYGYTLDPRDIRKILEKEKKKKNGEG